MPLFSSHDDNDEDDEDDGQTVRRSVRSGMRKIRIKMPEKWSELKKCQRAIDQDRDRQNVWN